MTTTTKDTIIAECCLDEGRPGKLMDTLTAARSRDPSVRMADVRDWLRRHGERLVGGAGEASTLGVPEEYILKAYEKLLESGKPTAREVHSRAKELAREYLMTKKFTKTQAQQLATDKIKFEDVKDWLEKKQKAEAPPKPSEASSSSSGQPAPPPAKKEPEPEPLPTAKEQLIAEAYNQYGNFGNVAKTLKAARLLDRSITRKDVQQWKDKNHAPLRAHRGLNSYVAKKPKEEYQMDLMFFRDLDRETEAKYEGALLMVDIFTKYCWATPIRSKETEDIQTAIEKCIKKMGGKPKSIYHDAETTFTGRDMQQWLVANNIQPITTLTHAPVAERTIRTIKNLLYPRVRHFGNPWWEELPKVLEIYNTEDKHRSTGFTPEEAKKKENQDDVRLNLELNRRSGRKYDPIYRGDKVRVVRKKKVNEKENNPPFYPGTWKVTSVGAKEKGRAQGVTNVQVDTADRALPAMKPYLMRHEVVKVPSFAPAPNLTRRGRRPAPARDQV
jgi:transposase InsO family protein